MARVSPRLRPEVECEYSPDSSDLFAVGNMVIMMKFPNGPIPIAMSKKDIEDMVGVVTRITSIHQGGTISISGGWKYDWPQIWFDKVKRLDKSVNESFVLSEQFEIEHINDDESDKEVWRGGRYG